MANLSVNITEPEFDADYYEDILRKSRYLAKNFFPYYTSSLLAMKFNITARAMDFNGNPTFSVDQYFRCYAHPVAIDNWLSQAKAVSQQNPCPVCGKHSHGPFAYIAGVLIHEMSHPLRKHFLRAEKFLGKTIKIPEGLKDAARFNIAADLEINDSIMEAAKFVNTDKICLPPGVMYPKMKPYNFEDGLFMEEYYDLLKDKEIDENQAGKCGSGADGLPREFGEPGEGDPNFNGVGEAAREAISKKVASDIKDYAAKHPGSISGGLARWADAYIAPAKRNWRKELTQVIRYSIGRVIPGDKLTTYARRSPITTVLNDIAILPSYNRPLPEVSIIIDTSGSMSCKAGQDAIAEAEGVIKTIRCKTTIISCDAEARVVGQTRSMKGISLVGGGGTILSEGIKLALKQRKKPNVIILFTDGYDCFQMEKVNNCRIIVALVGEGVTDQAVPDWMTVIRIPVED